MDCQDFPLNPLQGGFLICYNYLMTTKKIAVISLSVFLIIILAEIIYNHFTGTGSFFYGPFSVPILISGLWLIGYGIRFIFVSFRDKTFGWIFYTFLLFWLVATVILLWVVIVTIQLFLALGKAMTG